LVTPAHFYYTPYPYVNPGRGESRRHLAGFFADYRGRKNRRLDAGVTKSLRRF